MSSLSKEESLEKSYIKDELRDFWREAPFENKWLPPPMAYVSIDHLLDIAAETVARLSCESGSSRQMRKNLRVSGGHGGRRYLWALHNTVEDVRETGIQDEDQFLHDLVHAMLKNNQNGYCNGLTEEKIDSVLDQVKGAHSDAPDDGLCLADEIETLTKLGAVTRTGSTDKQRSALFNALRHVRQAIRALNEFDMLVNDNQSSNEDTTQNSVPAIEDETDKPVVVDSEGHIENEEEQSKIEPVVEEPMNENTKTVDENTKSVEESDVESNIDSEIIETDTNNLETEDNRDGTASPVVETTNKKEFDELRKSVASEGESENPVVDEPDTKSSRAPPATDEDKQVKKPRLNEEQSEKNENDMSDDEEEKLLKSGQLKIERVDKDVNRIRTHIQNIKQMSNKFSVDSEDIENEETELERLQRTTLGYTENLMKDLLELDGITGAPALRPLRKKSVKQIQSLMDDVDVLRKRLKAVYESVHEKAEIRRKEKEQAEQQRKEEELKKQQEKQAETVETPSSNANKKQKVHFEDEDDVEVEDEDEEEENDITPDEIDWSQLKFQAKFQVGEDARSYHLDAYVPSLKREDVKLSLDESGTHLDPYPQLIVSGVVLPEADVIEELWQNALAVKARDKQRGRYARFHGVPASSLVLRAAYGRYGSFQERFQLPSDADIDHINASLSRGWLRVVIPKVVRRRRPVQMAPSFFY